MTNPCARALLRLALACAAVSAAGLGQAQSPSRGELLYSTHCLDCHSSQMHWRARRQARDWDTLRAWVQHWHIEARLQWSEADVEAVARYLNQTIYHFPDPHPQASR